jgi:hypothetical protein
MEIIFHETGLVEIMIQGRPYLLTAEEFERAERRGETVTRNRKTADRLATEKMDLLHPSATNQAEV